MNERQKDQLWLEQDRARNERLASQWPRNLPAWKAQLHWTHEQIAEASVFWGRLNPAEVERGEVVWLQCNGEDVRAVLTDRPAGTVVNVL